jgi:putative Holliday junction resolvase
VTNGGGRILGIDYGSRRLGLAIAEADGLAARPLATIDLGRGASAPSGGAAGGSEAHPGPDPRTIAQIGRLVSQHGVAELVVGLPLDANGDHGRMAAAVRTWAAALGAALDLPVTLRDERLTSSLAEDRLGPMPRGRSGGAPSRTQRDRYRGRVDREAAAIILQDELDARRSAPR